MDKAQLVLHFMFWQLIGKVFRALDLDVRLTVRLSPLAFTAEWGGQVIPISFGALTAWNDPEVAAKEIFIRLGGQALTGQTWPELVRRAGFEDGHVPYL